MDEKQQDCIYTLTADEQRQFVEECHDRMKRTDTYADRATYASYVHLQLPGGKEIEANVTLSQPIYGHYERDCNFWYEEPRGVIEIAEIDDFLLYQGDDVIPINEQPIIEAFKHANYEC